MTKALGWFRAHGSDLVRDASGLAGAALVAVGAGQIYAPAGYIVGGALLVVGSFLSARAKA